MKELPYLASSRACGLFHSFFPAPIKVQKVLARKLREDSVEYGALVWLRPYKAERQSIVQ